MRVALFLSWLSERSIYMLRSARFASQRNDIRRQRNDSQAKRPITRDTFIHCYTVRLSKSPFFFRVWPHDLIEVRFARLIELMRGRLVASLLYTKGYGLSFAHAITRNTASYPNPSLPNSKNLTWDDKQTVEYFSSQFFKRRTIKH